MSSPTQSSNRPAAIIVTHTTQVFGPPFALANYWRAKGGDLILIDHPLDFDPNRTSRLTIWRDNKISLEKSYPNWHSSRPINYLKDFFITWLWLWRYARGRDFNYYFGFDSLACIAGLWAKPFVKINHFIGYNADYSTLRFDSRFLNAIYLWADRYSMARVDKIWCVTERIAAIRRRQRPNPANVIVVPNGVYVKSVRTKGTHDKGLVFIGNLAKEKGLDLLIEALAKVPKVRLTIYGDGGERQDLEKLTAKRGLIERVTFAGQTDNQTILNLLADYQAGVALYQASQSYVYYSDPLKVKEYLAAGLPVIITRVPEIADIIEQEKAGVVIESPDQFALAISQVVARRATISQQALALAKRYDWDSLLASAFSQTERLS